MKNKSIVIPAGLALVGLIGLGAIEGNKKAESAKATSLRNAEYCITVNSKPNASPTTACDRAKPNLLSEEKRAEFAVAFAKHTEMKAKKAAERKAAFAKLEAKEKARKAKLAEENRKAAAKFKAEGWWQQQPGIYVRWCTDKNPCPYTKSYQDYTWRAMVWCKERACGDIYARLNISQNGTVVGWTNETAYGGYNQKVVLTFGSYTRGQGSIVEFIARG